MTDAPTRSTRTPADLKWLLNERAAIAGEIASAQTRKLTLERRLLRLQRQTTELTFELAGASRALTSSQHSLSALDRAIELAYAQANPAAAGVVKAWAGKYGKRGGLKEYLVQVLKDAYPQPVPFTLLKDRTAAHFGLPYATTEDRHRLRSPLKNTLRILEDKGLVQTQHDPSCNQPSLWLWVGAKVPTLGALAAQAAALQVDGSYDRGDGSPANAARGEVACQ